ncbi:cytochrome b/b6 domain-containing protein [Pseudomonas gingeri]|uniref:Cytochrome b/b6 domain-containing protein n=1 Tax=Pseudomonas gingeri TaxID=117681 RepID=A0A7Y8C2P5_9PSED|nr:cytochrome b/b6 domain-containing protein [Pseudomonas gingeri]NWB97338.1 cytochrome b/b6 domain-containing protein [Pseudomonas gingeri]NWD76373.1 cytochrome b/b6 domain-containing protein [Pseudomonas gingeri]
MFLHWLSAAIILWALVSGFYVAFLSTSLALKQVVGSFNVSVTALFIPFFVVRIFLSFSPREQTARTLAQWTAFWVHKVIYLVTGIVLATGVMMMDRAINLFDLLLIPAPIDSAGLIAVFKKLHDVSCVVLAVLVVLHIGAVIRHEVSGHRILRRMLW